MQWRDRHKPKAERRQGYAVGISGRRAHLHPAHRPDPAAHRGRAAGAGARLPSVRDLAAEAGVNPNTMQRALTELEREGIVHSQRTAGRFVTEDAERIRQLRVELARQRVKDFLEGMFQLGSRRAEILALITQEADENAEGEEKTP